MTGPTLSTGARRDCRLPLQNTSRCSSCPSRAVASGRWVVKEVCKQSKVWAERQNHPDRLFSSELRSSPAAPSFAVVLSVPGPGSLLSGCWESQGMEQ